MPSGLGRYQETRALPDVQLLPPSAVSRQRPGARPVRTGVGAVTNPLRVLRHRIRCDARACAPTNQWTRTRHSRQRGAGDYWEPCTISWHC